MSAREIIAQTLIKATGTGESCEMKARWISESLTDAGYRILGPGELERCAQRVWLLAKQGATADELAAAIRSLTGEAK